MTEATPARLPSSELRGNYNSKFQAITKGKATSYKDLTSLISTGLEYYGSMFRKTGESYSFIGNPNRVVPITSDEFPFFEFEFFQRYLAASQQDTANGPASRNPYSPDYDFGPKERLCLEMQTLFLGLGQPEQHPEFVVTGSEKEFGKSTLLKKMWYLVFARKNWENMQRTAHIQEVYERTGIVLDKDRLKASEKMK